MSTAPLALKNSRNLLQCYRYFRLLLYSSTFVIEDYNFGVVGISSLWILYLPYLNSVSSPLQLKNK
jgi:hypothetical protein